MNRSDDDMMEAQEHEESRSLLSDPTVALLAAGAIGFAVGAVIWRYRKSNTSSYGSFERAFDMARSGATDTVQKLRRRLQDEGYSPAQLEGAAKKHLGRFIDAVQRRAY
ncbi:hypothetical protein [Hyphomicrobium sp.]|uniref:hypothetical protein n=1 Tax=Hyphomicrobium sp. TaxID=82 RepID=UPI001D67721F|nr:hypothetical protein [Hyphomicrobium sp.]MBY0559757.1 hypothetical protein [Hyphomicrobium sp.]